MLHNRSTHYICIVSNSVKLPVKCSPCHSIKEQAGTISLQAKNLVCAVCDHEILFLINQYTNKPVVQYEHGLIIKNPRE